MNQKWTVTLGALPRNPEELKASGLLDFTKPQNIAAMTVAALDVCASDRETGYAMLDVLKGPQPLSPYEKQFIRDRFMDKDYVPRSYFSGATPENNYTPSQPYTLVVEELPRSRDQEGEGYLQLFLTSGGADSPRGVKLRTKKSTGEWFLWEQYLLAGIRQPVAADPWA